MIDTNDFIQFIAFQENEKELKEKYQKEEEHKLKQKQEPKEDE